MKNGFDQGQDLSLPSVSFQNRSLELSPRQAEIYRNLEAIGPEIAAFYLSGVKLLQNDDLETSSYLLAHIAREIEGGLRDVLSNAQEKKKIQRQLKKADIGGLNERIGHIASILSALDIDDLRDPLAEKWIRVATRFHEFAHRHGAWETPREKEAFVPLWHEFEDVLAKLVGTHFNLLNRLDRILDYEKPTEKIIKTLPNLLKSEVRQSYFFKKLDSPAWLKPLKDAGWFDPESRPLAQEVVDQSESYATVPWYALEYVETVANHVKDSFCDETVDILIDIINTMVDYANDTGKSLGNDLTDHRVIKIICTFPIERMESRHIIYIGVALKSRGNSPSLVNCTISDIILPKLLNEGAEELILGLLEVMLDAKVVNRRIIPVMEEHWLGEAFETYGAAIAKVCGVKAAQITLAQIRSLIDDGAYSFDFIQRVGSPASDISRADYAELLANFVSRLLQFSEPDSVAETVGTLLQESYTLIRRIALTAVMHHYKDLKQFLWEWQGNPLEVVKLKPEFYQLIQTNCCVFNESEIEQILQWIESAKYEVSAKDIETQTKVVAYKKREWLSALLVTDNQKVISASQKYEQINPVELEHPGLLWWTEIGWGDPSPVTVEDLSDKSNAQIASFLKSFKEREDSDPLVPTQEGLRQTFEECVTSDPQRFTADLHLFQDIRVSYQHSILSGFLTAWRDKKEFDWAPLLEFIHQILYSESLWNKQDHPGLNYRNWVISTVADLVTAGTADDKHAFSPQLLTLAENILLVLVEKVESNSPVIATRNGISMIDLPTTFFGSVKCKVFTAMINHALRCARTSNVAQGERWSLTIKEAFSKKLDREVEPFIGLPFAFGAYLPNLFYLDEEWVIDNIDRIFSQEDEGSWYTTFLGYLYYSNVVHVPLYSLLKERGYYQKVISTGFVDFADEVLLEDVYQQLVAHVYVGWIENLEMLDDETSLIYQLINSGKPNLLSALIHFFWRQRDTLPEEMKAKVKPAWRALYKNLSQKSDMLEYKEVLSRLSGWVALVDKIDGEVLKWLKMSTHHIRGLTDSAFFVEGLLSHTSKTPAEVGEIYLEMLYHDVYPYHDQEHIQGIVRVLYNTKHKEVANQICNLYGEAGFDFLRSLYDDNQN